MYLISVYFDNNTNKVLNRYITKLAECTGNTFMTDNNVPPHLTISAIEAKSVDVLIPSFESLKERLIGGEISIASVGQLFPGVIYVSPVLNRYLQDIMDIVYDEFKCIDETMVSRYYQPYSWLPHITIGKQLDKEQMQSAFACLQESFGPMKARVCKIALSKVNPHEDVIVFDI